jgi:hypothetical protein
MGDYLRFITIIIDVNLSDGVCDNIASIDFTPACIKERHRLMTDEISSRSLCSRGHEFNAAVGVEHTTHSSRWQFITRIAAINPLLRERKKHFTSLARTIIHT